MTKNSFQGFSADQIHSFQKSLEERVRKSHSEITLKPAENCILTKLKVAATHANLSYYVSKLHPNSTDQLTNISTRQLFNTHKTKIIDVYDSDLQTSRLGAIILSGTDQTTIAFHGINFDSQQDHLINFESALVSSNFAPGTYHRGFLNLALRIAPKLTKILQNNTENDWKKCPLKIYGHSMGGSIAQIFTQYLQHLYNNLDLETIVFGSPKVMCKTAAKAYNTLNKKRTLRVENPLDLAIYMPSKFMGYEVVNHSLLLPEAYSNISRNHEIEGYLESINRLKTYFADIGVNTISLEHYRAAMQRLNPMSPFFSSVPISEQIQTPFREFLGIMGHGISQGIQSVIRKLPF